MKKTTIKQFSEHAILLDWEVVIDEKINQLVLATAHHLKKRFTTEILEIVPSYHSLAIYVVDTIDVKRFIIELDTFLKTIETIKKKAQNCIYIPVCYDAEFGIDIATVAAYCNSTIDEVIEMHTAVTYLVYFLGFLPGFPYLGGLNDNLSIPRKKSPRLNVVGGSVAIGGSQTGIYPSNSPGGWHIIGRTPLPLFSIDGVDGITLLQAGDTIKFVSIDKYEFDTISIQIHQGTYKVRKEVIND